MTILSRRGLIGVGAGGLLVSGCDRLSGSMANFPEFDEVVRLGQAARHADRPQDQPGTISA